MAATTQNGPFRLGAVTGIPVLLSRSWFFLAVVIAFVVGPQVDGYVDGLGTTGAYLVGLGFGGLLLVSVFLHELAHALTAKAFGVPPTEIVLDLFGGHTAFSREMPTPGRSIVVAAVGPATNGVIAVAAGFATLLTTPRRVPEMLLLLLAYSNGLVAVLNALPGLPLDGGRVFEGIVWAATRNRTTGTAVAGRAGQVVAVGVVVWFVGRPYLSTGRVDVVNTVWIGLIAWMLWRGATNAIRYAAFRRAADGVVAGQLMRPAVVLSAAASAADARAAAGSAPGAALVVLDPYGRPVGVVDETALAQTPPERAGLVQALSVCRALPPVVLTPDLRGESLVQHLRSVPAAEYAVAEGGRVVGVLSAAAVSEAVSRR